MKILPFVLLTIGTLGLFIIEFTEGSRYLTLTFAGLNVLGLVTLYALVLRRKKVQ